jgi:hypothetical protein
MVVKELSLVKLFEVRVFILEKFGTKRKTVYTATIISNKGLWTKFVLDKKEKRKLINLLQMMERIEFI